MSDRPWSEAEDAYRLRSGLSSWSDDQPDPIDWPARFRAAADVARAEGWPSHGNLLLALAGWMALDRAAVAAVGRALLGEDGGQDR